MRRRIRDVTPRMIAARLPADDGWRIIWYRYLEENAGVRLVHPMIGIRVDVITAWGIEAPRITPGDPHLAKPVVEWSIDGLIPMVGKPPARLPHDAHYFEIIDPWDPRSAKELVKRCDEWFAIVDGSQGRKQPPMPGGQDDDER